MTWFKFLSDIHSLWNDYYGIHKDLLIKNSESDWIPKIFEVKVYKVTDAKKDDAVDILGTEYLSEIDANILGYNIDKMNEVTTDMFEYSKDISHLLDNIEKRVKRLIKYYKDIIEEKGQQRIKFDEEEEKEYLNKVSKILKKYTDRLSSVEDNKYYERD
jgi:ribosomal protein S15P/S13E